ncbi:MAG: SpoIIE family protein phosphatase [Bacteroidota bacterium]
MMNDMFVEVDYCQKQKAGNEICGDVFLSQKISAENRTISILSDGLGSGIKANILASMTGSMAMNFMKANAPIQHTAKIIMNTLPMDTVRKVSFSSFTIIDIQDNERVKLMEYGNPGALIWKQGKLFEPEKKRIDIERTNVKHGLYISEFDVNLNDRIIIFSDGVIQSGIGSEQMPFGWGRQPLTDFLHRYLEGNEHVSAGDVSYAILKESLKNDHFQAKDDITCGTIFLRPPRKVLFCTGPPYKQENDAYLAEQVLNFQGHKIISGGTTAQILSRQLNCEVDVNINNAFEGLPPESTMEGVDLVTEGILTIGKVSEYLQKLDQLRGDIPGPAGKIIKYFYQNDAVYFLVGTRVNEAHQDPNLPVELEIRRNVIKKIARLLEEKFLKKTEITYI